MSSGGGPHRPDSLREIPRPGEIVGAKYRIEHVIGRGGMGVVVAARHTTLKRHVALKFLLPKENRTAQNVARFLREAQAAAAITSQHVAHVIDVGTTEAGLPYFVMELLRGINLAELIEQRGPLSIEDAVGYVLEVCEPIAEAHALGIVHRDLKPSNIFLAEREDGSRQIKVIDFGISKTLDASELGVDGKLTSTHMVLGSPPYMSPEHVRSARCVDARTDIWAIGVILYEMLTARRPFEAEAASAIFASIVADPPTPPRSHRADLPHELERVILSCLEKRPYLRPQTVADLAQALAPFAPERARTPLERILCSGPGAATVRASTAGAHGPVDLDGPTLTLELAERREAAAGNTALPASLSAPLPEPRADPARDGAEPAPPRAAAEGGAPAGRTATAMSVAKLVESTTPARHAPEDGGDEEDRAGATMRARRPARRAHVLLGAAVVALAGLGFVALRGPGEREPGLRSDPHQDPQQKEHQRQRVHEACKQSRMRLQSGAALSPLEGIGWEVDLWLASGVGRPVAEERPSPDGAARAPAREPAGGATPTASAPAPPLTAASLGDIAAGGRITPALDAALSRVADGTVAVKQGVPASSRAFSDVTVTFGEGYSRAFFDAQVRPRFIAIAERLYQAAGADVGALYARCAELAAPDLGVWFRGRDASGAAAALLHHMEMRAEPSPSALLARSPVDATGRVRSLRAKVDGAGLDDKALQELLNQLGAHVVPSQTGTAVTFPAEAPLRARIVSRELSDVLDAAERGAP
ncbi:serine/threonine-protein kinase [Sorangium sp. So ce375]|uniref:serine/threonine-protein kinase n=1 Tax=Sorangium sp. So ce375 TaxID=3133306 RepID=UPI003F5C27BD